MSAWDVIEAVQGMMTNLRSVPIFLSGTPEYLGNLSDVNVIAAEAEITTAKTFLQYKFGSEKTYLHEIIAILHGYEEALPYSYQSAAAALNTLVKQVAELAEGRYLHFDGQ
ncbi:hypothetical protein T07_14056 [Trichinella nelsoni]|uniref:Uncharacterized protein n=1 Tax=Trichinella nelsoni TaxID=6336 RepID=A0A0V0SLK8_9BILA|nr:hypothetical protein T07_14056 [Trichinella nelsoni]